MNLPFGLNYGCYQAQLQKYIPHLAKLVGNKQDQGVYFNKK